jgi:hypothetical protein
MRMNIIALASLSFLSLHSQALEMPKGLPHFNIERTCREARAYAGADKQVAYKGCLKDEAEARLQLAQKWTRFKQADRSDCVIQGAAPIPSYVELLTCLEMSAEVEGLNAPDGMRGNWARGSARQSPPGPAQGIPPNEAPTAPLEHGTLAKPN